jgi:hypothetical protein
VFGRYSGLSKESDGGTKRGSDMTDETLDYLWYIAKEMFEDKFSGYDTQELALENFKMFNYAFKKGYEFAIERKEKESCLNLSFGDYVEIEQKRYGCENEIYLHKVINVFKANHWVDVPVQTPAKEIIHNKSEMVVSCITCGVCETEVLNYRIKDVKKAGKDKWNI